ncbi:MAG: bifunctional hydroxymethylpyrimidine kinase/phosphomethylpyrimidine kinase, partial [Paraglaciecola sp.]|nr:bifunctional hydroxymethylpyrimidine kinase/phosphomethylpyrimidine kinase [Paraglaciecola sp.]
MGSPISQAKSVAQLSGPQATHVSSSVIWTVAGSDSSGGAGIQADIKTAHDFAVHAATVITAVTAQNSLGVNYIDVISEQSFTQQLMSLRDDMPPKVIKIGLLASVAQVNALASLIRGFVNTGVNTGGDTSDSTQTRPFVVLDPVQVASTGDAMAEKGVTEAIKNTLLPLVDLLTPNLVELAILANIECGDLHAQQKAAAHLISKGCKAILVKGGHAGGQYSIDRYFSATSSFSMSSLRLNTMHTHGTGCTLSSAISAALAKGYLLEDAL